MTKAKTTFVVTHVSFFDSRDCESRVVSRHASYRAANNKAQKLAARERGFFTVHPARTI